METYRKIPISFPGQMQFIIPAHQYHFQNPLYLTAISDVNYLANINPNHG